MPLKTTSPEAVPTIGIDIGKNTFHLIGLDKMGAIVLRQKSRTTRSTLGAPTCRVASSAWRRASGRIT
jgi:hypothetical protein